MQTDIIAGGEGLTAKRAKTSGGQWSVPVVGDQFLHPM